MTPEERARAITFPSGKRGADFAEHLRVKIANAIRAVVEEERERCARIAANTVGPLWHVDTATEIAAAIRNTNAPA